MKVKRNMKPFQEILLLLLLLTPVTLVAQDITITGKVTSTESGRPLVNAQVFIQESNVSTLTDKQGLYKLTNIKAGRYTLVAFYLGLETQGKEIEVRSGKDANYSFDFSLDAIEQELENVVIRQEREETQGIRRLNAVEGFGIYEAKKNDVIVLNDVVANKASNNARQVFAKVSGLNIWESDCAGLQIGVGSRGLSPNRNSNFNTRQNGYDISADALGYPESYYSPPIQAVDRVEIVRGAASLQYGTQFGGLVNFELKKGPEDKKIELNTEQTYNSLGFYSGFNSVGGKVGKVRYYGYNRYATGNCWRCNSDFESTTSYLNLDIEVSDKLTIGTQYTHSYYLAQQPGGLTDAQFEEDARQSVRERNWFRVNWNLFALNIDYRISSSLKLNLRNFGLVGGRDALGNLGRIDRPDDQGERDLFVDDFRNFGTELRLIKNYQLFNFPSVFLVGGRYYNGLTLRKQGNGPAGDTDDFTFLNPNNLEGSDFEFPGSNVSLFAENIFTLNDKWTLTPGVRFEHINTEADGQYQSSVLVRDPTTGLAVDSTFQIPETLEKPRSFVFFGIGVGYKPTDNLEFYANISENYRSINFNDVRVVNPNLVVDQQISDERGFNVDIGFRGRKSAIFNYDVSAFYLQYSDRIGSFLQVDETSLRIFRFRTNVSDSRNVGIEAFGEVNLNHFWNIMERGSLNLFANVSVIDARYVNSENPAIDGNKVELVPPFSVKSGLSYARNKLKLSYQVSYTQRHFTDATNVEVTPSAIEGGIPSYYVMDLSGSYTLNEHFGVEAGVNNLTNSIYFTRRASGYPGPGIIPSDGRSFYFTLKGRFWK